MERKDCVCSTMTTTNSVRFPFVQYCLCDWGNVCSSTTIWQNLYHFPFFVFVFGLHILFIRRIFIAARMVEWWNGEMVKVKMNEQQRLLRFLWARLQMWSAGAFCAKLCHQNGMRMPYAVCKHRPDNKDRILNTETEIGECAPKPLPLLLKRMPYIYMSSNVWRYCNAM